MMVMRCGGVLVYLRSASRPRNAGDQRHMEACLLRVEAVRSGIVVVYALG